MKLSSEFQAKLGKCVRKQTCLLCQISFQRCNNSKSWFMGISNWYHESFIDSLSHKSIQKCRFYTNHRTEYGKLNRGSMVINLSFFIKFELMLNNFNMFFQPYFMFQSPETAFSTLICQQNQPFLLPQFHQTNWLQSHQFVPNLQPSANLNPALPSEAFSKNLVKAGSSICQRTKDNYIIKEKIIKKPANRPATYITERKYYLAQKLQAQDTTNRVLRARNLKKKSHKHHHAPTQARIEADNQMLINSRTDPCLQVLPQTPQQPRTLSNSCEEKIFSKQITEISQELHPLSQH